MTPLEEFIDRKANYLAAEKRLVLESQEYQIGQGSTARRKVSVALADVRAEIASLNIEIGRLQSAASGVRRVRYIRAI